MTYDILRLTRKHDTKCVSVFFLSLFTVFMLAGALVGCMMLHATNSTLTDKADKGRFGSGAIFCLKGAKRQSQFVAFEIQSACSCHLYLYRCLSMGLLSSHDLLKLRKDYYFEPSVKLTKWQPLCFELHKLDRY